MKPCGENYQQSFSSSYGRGYSAPAPYHPKHLKPQMFVPSQAPQIQQGTGNPNYQKGPRVGGSLSNIPSQVGRCLRFWLGPQHLGDLCQLLVQEYKDLPWVQHSPAALLSQHKFNQKKLLPHPQPTVQRVDTSSVPAKTYHMILTLLFNETSEALGGSHANPVKKREIEDNSRKIGALFAKLSSGDI
ncbi:hypothetical protein RHMOL_Rhmol09G0049200 [Rhododendron molle]|uniref:Uncharacterized protein n=1 Tax=Rhododendron molle TaxID=49168 RepID=A0ACC0MAH3_RHOML|nr:hypothetical protein RHMOL_Rhmol09G0049200 [Rhododendron molle]